jgi:transcriptional regulator with XRE-family HTH domain
MAVRRTLGETIRFVRESRSMSAAQLAERADLAPDLVDRIESGALLPSLSPLIRIARSLGVRLGALLDEQETLGPVVVRNGEQGTTMHFSGGEGAGRGDLDFFSLAANKMGRHMEPFLIDVHPLSARATRPSTHEGEEFVYVLAGEVEVLYGRDSYRLKAGDSIYYDSIVPHHVHSGDGAEARVLVVVYAP